jgi:hypothetical protein
MLSDFPKIQCPFIRVEFDVDKDDWKKHGRRLQLRTPKAYLVIDTVNPGYEWVFDDPDTIAVEKLDGSNVKIHTEDGRLMEMQNRKNVIDPLQIVKGKAFLVEGVLLSAAKGMIKPDGFQAGELLGPKLQGNPYNLTTHEWYPFESALEKLAYRSFHEHDRTFDNWNNWFKDYLTSRFYMKRAKQRVPGSPDSVMAEGIVFHNPRRRAEGKTNMAKLRRDMFPWFYEGVEIFGYDKDMTPAPSPTA